MWRAPRFRQMALSERQENLKKPSRFIPLIQLKVDVAVTKRRHNVFDLVYRLMFSHIALATFTA